MNIEISKTSSTKAATKHPLSVNVSGEQHPKMNSTAPRKANRKLREIAKASLSLTMLSKHKRTAVTIITVLEKQTLKGVYAVRINPKTTLSTSIRNAIIRVTFFISFTIEVVLVE